METPKEEFIIRLDALFDEFITGKTCLGVYEMTRKTDWRILKLAPMFNNVVLRSTLVSAVLSAHKIYSNDQVSLNSFLDVAEALAQSFRGASEDEVWEQIQKTRAHITSLADVTKRLAIRRNNGIGHLSKEIVFQKERIEKRMEMTIAEVTALFDYAAETLNTFNRMWNGTTSLNYVRHDDDYKRLLNILIAHENAEIQRHNDAFPFDVMDKIEP
jgi:hypothetical protein